MQSKTWRSAIGLPVQIACAGPGRATQPLHRLVVQSPRTSIEEKNKSLAYWNKIRFTHVQLIDIRAPDAAQEPRTGCINPVLKGHGFSCTTKFDEADVLKGHGFSRAAE
jgi:hypothetical protein